jgi:hypothetical protein
MDMFKEFNITMLLNSLIHPLNMRLTVLLIEVVLNQAWSTFVRIVSQCAIFSHSKKS